MTVLVAQIILGPFTSLELIWMKKDMEDCLYEFGELQIEGNPSQSFIFDINDFEQYIEHSLTSMGRRFKYIIKEDNQKPTISLEYGAAEVAEVYALKYMLDMLIKENKGNVCNIIRLELFIQFRTEGSSNLRPNDVNWLDHLLNKEPEYTVLNVTRYFKLLSMELEI
ncbi:hypothetical protein PHYBLDRAFT_165247 [Phycomyces blakesleeanus NRRL 1555(-)]|uniref:Uncharacterized protein n=1 Tax=Phycomyces blakesleeanus (strain ATCC 8743b / DSM 1359 / FGSC 10004 / NBRC 33097 / NRRL 1555) TaxID=763407 RepID=A0A167NW94_PHYB8|nr:hypothetical protein PHYBLDRAFT_165247 [Phycomyces blakesleeanus NRRL 1555(-)]OAD76731.1 hypothetical protein PHYBLDRAFT_165247 [Phycomyces blakesleeanus NRRL 1555(-)]|eukprot:XP_018294771.1 hypothetical protein PHYBLDRAFT_165247 [Phycomyces blakesleeanus NRRL 1555(-)]